MTNKYEEARNKGTTKVAIDRAIVRKHPHSEFNIYLMSDLHCGAMECDYTLLENAVNLIADDKKALVILGGDLIEAIPRGYKINEEGQHCGIDQQIALTINELKKVQNKIIAIFKGNHNTKARGESIDSDFIIAQALSAPYKTVPSMIHVSTPKGTIKLAGGHGHSTARNSDAELEQVRKIYPNAHIYFLGHDHSLYCKHVGGLVYDDDGHEHWERVWFARTGSFLKYAEYARYAMYAPKRTGFIKLTVSNGEIKTGSVITEDSFK